MDIETKAYPNYIAYREAHAAELIVESGLAQSDSYSSLQAKISAAVNANVMAGVDMDCDDDGVEDAKEGKYAWVQDMFPGQAIYSMDGRLFQCTYTVDAAGDVTLGAPKEVEMAYQPVAPVQESARLMAISYTPLQESSYDATKGELTITVIKPGLSKNNRFYPTEVLKRDFNIFEGVQMFADHQTPKESNERPEGSVNNWVAVMGKPWCESDGTVRATATVIDPTFKAKLERLSEVKQLGKMGISIRAVGEAYHKKEDGQTITMVESLIAARSVDFVTSPGAGGRVETIESATDANDVDVISESDLRKRRPDLVTLIESNAPKDTAMKTLEQQLQEANAKITAQAAQLEEANKATVAANKVAAQAELTRLLTESKLPAKAQDRLKKQFSEAVEVKGMAEAIAEEADYVKSIAPAVTKNNGESANGTITESDPDKTQANLTEAFGLLGLSKESAAVAAKRR